MFENKKYILEFMVFFRYFSRGRYGVLVKCIGEKSKNTMLADLEFDL